MVRRAVFLFALVLFARPALASCDISGAPVYVATNAADLQDCFSKATHTGDIVHLSGAGIAASSQLTWTAPANSILYGDGTASKTTSGGDTAGCITDNYNSGNQLLQITTNATGTFRMHGLCFIPGSGDGNKFNAIIGISGNSKQVRIDHNHFNNVGYSGAPHPPLMRIGGYQYGVIDHNYVDPEGNTNPFKTDLAGMDSDGEGDTSWASDTEFGSDKFIFLEDNFFNPHNNGGQSNLNFNDLDHGGKMVARFNVGAQGSVQTHPTNGSVTARGGRAWEFYLNDFSSTDKPNANFNCAFLSSGTGIIWGNLATTGSCQNFITLHSMRRNNATYTAGGGAPPNGLGYCGPQYQTGTLSVVGTTATKITGPNFGTGWPAGTMIILNGITPDISISAVGSTSSLTLSGSPGNATYTYVVGSNFDGNSNTNTGYPCGDQPGSGKGDMLDGVWGVNKTNHRTGVGPTDPLFSVQQAREPIYEFLNTFSCSGCSTNTFLSVAEPDALGANVDYFLYNAGTCAAGGACTAGVGSGTTLPTTCTVNTGFWKTDEGSWNDRSNAFYVDEGVLYKCSTTNNWTLYYTPYPYPHPLISGGDSTVPTAGASGAITFASVTSSSITINWTKGTDNVSAQGALQYEVCRSASTISSVGTCESNIVMSFTTDVATYADSGLAASTTYHYNVVVKDEAGNKTIYADNSQATSAVVSTPGAGLRINIRAR